MKEQSGEYLVFQIKPHAKTTNSESKTTNRNLKCSIGQLCTEPLN